MIPPQINRRLDDAPKIVLLGPRAVGKTALAQRLSREEFLPEPATSHCPSCSSSRLLQKRPLNRFIKRTLRTISRYIEAGRNRRADLAPGQPARRGLSRKGRVELCRDRFTLR